MYNISRKGNVQSINKDHLTQNKINIHNMIINLTITTNRNIILEYKKNTRYSLIIQLKLRL